MLKVWGVAAVQGITGVTVGRQAAQDLGPRAQLLFKRYMTQS